MLPLTDTVRDAWALRVRHRLPKSSHRAAAVVLRVLGLEARLLHWLVPPCIHEGFVGCSWATAEAVHRSIGLVAAAGPGGDYYEFGLYRGYTFWLAQQVAGFNRLSRMRFFGFDSFRGLPPPDPGDAVGNEFHAGEFACSREAVSNHLSRFGVDWDRTHLIEGFYETSLTAEVRANLQMGPAAVVLVDCDLYESASQVLEFVSALLQDGTIVLFDDWNSFSASDAHGERRAFREFLTNHPVWTSEELFPFGSHGHAFRIHRTPPARADVR
jgi:O-methyltransferase